MATIDPFTRKPYPDDAISRVLHITTKVHVYQIPPDQFSRGYQAASWTDRPAIFAARLRVIETAIPGSTSSKEVVSANILLEDPASGELFAAAPYSTLSSVTPANDSSRFFAVRVQGEGGMKATLGVGFEERADAIDFGIALQEAAKVLGLAQPSMKPPLGVSSRQKAPSLEQPQRDYSLKEGETITINIGSRQGRRPPAANTMDSSPLSRPDQATSFLLPPPPSAAQVRQNIKNQREQAGAEEDEFGDFVS